MSDIGDLGDKIFSKVSEGKDVLTNLASKIPGFGGYIKRQERRNSDKLLREAVAARFEEQWGRVSGMQTEFISAGEIGYVDDLERAAIKLRTFADRIRTATRGHSSFFEAVKINEEELARIYEYDSSLMDLAEEVGQAIDNVQASVGTDGVGAAIKNLEKTAQQCIDAFNKREEVVLAE